MDKVRFGVIGTGGMGSGHCRWMHTIDEAVLTAVCDTEPAAVAAMAEQHSVPSFATSVELLDSGLVDAVVIATPHYFHPTIAIEAFERGIHVLSEKPIAVTVSAADAMIAAARAADLKFGVMFQLRSLGRMQAARRIIQEGLLGEIYRTSMVVGWYRSQAYYDSGGWRATWTGEGGGVLINQAPHFLDLFQWLGGMPTRVTGATRTRLHDIEVEDEAFATVEYANGAHGYLYASTTEAPSHELFEICGDRGKLMLQGETLRFWSIDEPIREHSRGAATMWGGPKAEETAVEIPEGGGRHMDITGNFCRAILNGEPLIAPGEEGIRAVELINGIILSSNTGAPVDLPVDRAAYDSLLESLKSASAGKKNLRETRETDPHYTGS